MNVLTPIKSLKDKDAISDRVLFVKDKNLGRGKNGKLFMTLFLGDKTGQLDTRLWDNVEEADGSINIGDFLKVKGVIQTFNHRKQLVLHRFENVNHENYKKEDYVLAEVELDTYALFAELTQVIQTMESSHIKQLCLDTINDEELKKLLLLSPAAKTIHHAKKGGLLAHIVSILKIMNFLGEHYKNLNRDLLLFGALFHDIGKLWELEINQNGQINYTDKGQLLGHMLMGCELIEKKTQRILGFPDDLRNILKHIILSHHGKIEYGSPKLPMCLEAVLIAMVDEMDSKMDTISNFINSEKETGENWSRYNENFDRYFIVENLKGKWS